MIADLVTSKNYPLSFTAASLRPDLARIVAEVFLACEDWELAKQKILSQNLLQARSQHSAVRMEREFRQRLQNLTHAQLKVLAIAPLESRRAIAWLSVLKHSPFVRVFAEETLRTKLEHMDPMLRPSDYEAFFEAEAIAHPELIALAVSTRVKIRLVLNRMLEEAGILAETGESRAFVRPIIPPDALDAILTDDPRWLAGFLVPDTEIRSPPTMNTLADTADRLFKILSHPHFLAMEGLANEVPIFIHAYPPNTEDETRDMVDHLAKRLRAKGIPLAQLDLFDQILAQLDAEGRLQRMIEREAAMGKQKLLEALRNLSDPKTRLIPLLIQKMEQESAQLTLLSGVGRVFPFLRTHNLLEALQPAMTRHPIVLFFPGDYVQESEGSQLHLFGAFPNPKLSRAYYRAFNLAHYQP